MTTRDATEQRDVVDILNEAAHTGLGVWEGDLERARDEITRLRASQAGGVPAGWNRNALVNAYLAGYWFAAKLVRHRDGVGTDQSAYECLDKFVTAAGRMNGLTVEQHAGEFADKALSASPPPPATDGTIDLALLSDPNVVHVNMLRGAIARPSLTCFLHLIGNGTLEAFRETVEIAARNEEAESVKIARAALEGAPPATDGEALRALKRGHVLIDYTNWRGERAVREIVPLSWKLGANEWHPDEQWMVLAHDVEKGADRWFALSGIHSWGRSALASVPTPVIRDFQITDVSGTDAVEVERAIKAEREACATLALACPGDFERDTDSRTVGATRRGIAAAIRSRGSQEARNVEA